MNKTKRFIVLILSLVLLCSFSLSVFATNVPTITISSKTASSGKVVTVDIKISNNPGIMAMAFSITYDTDALEYVKYTKGYLSDYTVKNHSDKGHVSFVNIESDDKSNNDTIISIDFKVKDNASAGTHIISLANSNRDTYGSSLKNCFSNSNQQAISVNLESGGITVPETCENSGHKYGGWEIIKAATCTKTGTKQRACIRCSATEEEQIPITHDFENEWTVDKAATPTEDGIMSRHCKNCDAVTDKFTFTYKEVEDSKDDNTSSDDSSADNSSSNNSSSSNSGTSSDNSLKEESSSENKPTGSEQSSQSSKVPSDTTSSGNSNSTNSSSSSSKNTTTSNSSSATGNLNNSGSNKEPINNTEGAKNPISVLDGIADFKENIEPNWEPNDTSLDYTQSQNTSLKNDDVSTEDTKSESTDSITNSIENDSSTENNDKSTGKEIIAQNNKPNDNSNNLTAGQIAVLVVGGLASVAIITPLVIRIVPFLKIK